MPIYTLRLWQRQVLFDSADYLVEAVSEKEAAGILDDCLDKAVNAAAGLHEDPRVTRADRYSSEAGLHRVSELDPRHVVDGYSGIDALEDGQPVRVVRGQENMPLEGRDLAMVLAALRLWQAAGPDTRVLGTAEAEAINEVATDGGLHELMTDAEIDALRARLNW